MFSTPCQQYNLHKQMHEIAFLQRKYIGTYGLPTLLPKCACSIINIPCQFYGCYIIIDIKMFKNSKGVLQGICSKLDGTLLLSIADNFMWQVIHRLRGIKHHL